MKAKAMKKTLSCILALTLTASMMSESLTAFAAAEGTGSAQEQPAENDAPAEEEDAPEAEGRYYIEEILGSSVINSETGALLGTLTDVFKTGANDVWQVSNNGKNYLLPVIDDLEIKVDIENEKITLKPLKGIFDDED